MKNWYLLLSLFITTRVSSQNLLVNPSAESGDPTSVGWTSVSMGTTGASCYNNSGWRIIQSLNGFPSAQQGSYFFYAGCSASTGSVFELRQDVSVSANAALIDAGWDSFTFSGYMQCYNQSPADQAEIIVEYRNAANTVVLASYNTGYTSNLSGWTLYVNAQVAPVGTRIIRVRLLGKVNTGPSIDAYFDNLSLTTSIPLPVSISSFNAVPEHAGVALLWTTTSENDNEYFTIQRSRDGQDWNDLENIPSTSLGGAGSSYTAYDKNPFSGVSYYRLKQTDFTGKSTFSAIKEVNFIRSFEDIVIFPNPATSFFTLKGDNLPNVQYAFYNNVGQLLFLNLTRQNNTVNFSTAGLSKGVYYLRLSDSRTSEIRKVVVE